MSKVKIFSISFLLVVVCGQAGFTFAQNWSRPESEPPENNPGQPPELGSLENYVKKSVVTTQSILGAVSFGAGTLIPAYLGNMSGLGVSVLGTSNGLPGIVGTNVGVYGNGGSRGIVANANGASSATYGIVGTSDSASGYGGRFYGPVAALNLSSPVVNGTVAIDTTLTAQGGLACPSPSCTLASGGYWLTGTHTAGSSAIRGKGSSGAGISITIDDGSNNNAPAVDSYPASPAQAAIVGYSNNGVGIYSNASGPAGLNYIGVAGVSKNTGTDATGIRAVSDGGVGSPNYGTSAAPDYDPAAGLRACVKQSDGTIVNKRGLTAKGSYSTLQSEGNGLPGSIDGINDGVFLIIPNSQGEGALRVGGQYMTKCDLQGVKNRMCDASNDPPYSQVSPNPTYVVYCKNPALPELDPNRYYCPTGCTNMIGC